MAVDLGGVRVTLTAITADFQKKMAAAVTALDKVKKEAREVAIGGGVALAAFAAAIYKGTKGIDEQNRAMIKLRAATSGRAFNVDAVAEYSGALQQLTRFGDDASISAAGTLARYVQTDKQVMQLLPHVQDLAEVTGQDLTSASTMVGRALAGNAGALNKMGVAMTPLQKKAFELANAQERLAIVTQALTDNYGGAAEAFGKTVSGSFLIMKNAMGEVLEAGASLIQQPLAATFRAIADAAFKLSEWITKLSPQAKTLVVALGAVGAGGTAVVTGLSTMAYFIPNIIDGYKKMATVLTAVGKASRIAFLPTLTWVAAIAAAIAGVILIIGSLKIAWDENLGGMRDTVKNFVTAIATFFETFFDWVTSKFKGLTDKVSEFAIYAQAFLSGGTRQEAEATIGAMRESGGNLFSVGQGTGFRDMLDGVERELSSAASNVGDSISKSWKAGTGVLSGVVSSFMSLIPAMDDATEATDKVAKAFDKLPSAEAFKIDYTAGYEHLAKQERDQQAMEYMRGVRGATAPIQQHADDFEAWARAHDTNFSATVTEVTSNLVGSLGDFGGAVNNAITAFQQGGPLGALASVFASLVIKTEAFGRISAVLGNVFASLSNAVEPLVESVEPLAELVAVIAKALGGPLKTVMTVLGLQIRAFTAVTKALVLGIAYVIKGIASIWNGIVSAIAAVFKKIGSISIFGKKPLGFLEKFGKSIERAKINLDGLNNAIDQAKNGYEANVDPDSLNASQQAAAATLQRQIEVLSKYGDQYANEIANLKNQLAAMADPANTWGPEDLPNLQAAYDKWMADYEKFGNVLFKANADAFLEIMTKILEEQAAASGKASDAMAETAEAAEKLNKELTNAPTGFKDAIYRFEAAVAGYDGREGDRMLRQVGAGDPDRNVLRNTVINIYANDKQEIVDTVRNALARDNVRVSGSSQSTGQPYSTSKNFRVRRNGI